MQVSQAMTQEVVSVTPGMTLTEAARAMKTFDIGPLPVCVGDRLVGMLTDRDITIRATAEGRDPMQTPVSDVMTPEVVCCLETDDVGTAAKLMQRAQLRRLLVVDRHGKLKGIVSLADLSLKTGDDKLVGETVEKVSEPVHASGTL
jgi:CBS domain-containing protein